MFFFSCVLQLHTPHFDGKTSTKGEVDEQSCSILGSRRTVVHSWYHLGSFGSIHKLHTEEARFPERLDEQSTCGNGFQSNQSIKTTKENDKDTLETKRRCIRVVGATSYELIANYGLRVRDNNTSGRVSE